MRRPRGVERIIGQFSRHFFYGDIVGLRRGTPFYNISQKGFTEYADGNWEGTLNDMVPGCGYIYMSVSAKDLILQPNKPVARYAKAPSVYKSSFDPGDVCREYSSTMNIVANLYQGDFSVEDGNFEIYAFSDDEYRGYGQKSGENYYITVYGDKEVLISFVVKDLTTGETFVVEEMLPFSNNVIGNRKSPFRLTFDNATCIETVIAKDSDLKVYSIDGVLLYNDASVKELEKLPKGIYIVDGRKHIVK